MEIRRSASFDERSRVWLTSGNHNFLRISRILRSLSLLGHGKNASALLECLEGIYDGTIAHHRSHDAGILAPSDHLTTKTRRHAQCFNTMNHEHGRSRSNRRRVDSQFRSDPYASLVNRIDAEPFTEEIVRGATRYQLELVCVWDSQPGGDVRVVASIDDGGLRAFFPLSRDFIKRSDGTFVGE